MIFRSLSTLELCSRCFITKIARSSSTPTITKMYLAPGCAGFGQSRSASSESFKVPLIELDAEYYENPSNKKTILDNLNIRDKSTRKDINASIVSQWSILCYDLI